MKIGRNDPCPCGSGKKYKFCCGRISPAEIRNDNFFKILSDNNIDEASSRAVFYLLRYIEDTPWKGGCHAVSSVLYVFLSEMGYNPSLCIGEVKTQFGKPFDHSWILISGKVIDLTIHIGLEEKGYSGPIIFDITLDSMQEHDVLYGIDFLGLGKEAMMVYNSKFTEYMNNFPRKTGGGLWSFVQTMFEIVDANFNLDYLKEKYKITQRIFVKKA